MKKPNPRHTNITPWVVCLTAALFFFYEFVQMSMFNAINPSLMIDFDTDAKALGLLSSAYFLANILFMLPAGMLLDRYSVKKVIVTTMLFCILGTLIFSMSQSLITAAICRFIVGIGGSFPYLACLRLASRWFKSTKLAFVSGVILTIPMLGGMLAQTPLSFLIIHVGWRHAILIDALLGGIFLIFILLWVKDYPQDENHSKTTIAKPSMRQNLSSILGNTQNWYYGIYTCMLNLPIFLLAQLWGSLYLTQAHHFSQLQSTTITTMIYLGTMIGSPLAGKLSDRLKCRKKPMFIGGFMSLALVLYLMFSHSNSEALMLTIFFALGLFTSTQVITYPAIIESNSQETIGGGLGLASVLIMAGGAITEPLFGWLMHLNTAGIHKISNTYVYASSNYLDALWILPIAFFIGLLALYFAKETCARSYTKNPSLCTFDKNH